ncbi:receptor-type tyrosine-protein phosphatase U-like isoform X2 [Sylvia atricapilla]|uniref:receptor-type tyrosine-protein phosphatase U-like isoform X2 n=1 Tax=Sylvia atricapilla TaxID=48155 RepID=UPI0033941854
MPGLRNSEWGSDFSPAWGLQARMALHSLALRFLLALATLLSAHGQEDLFNIQIVPQGTEMCRRPLWDPRLQLAPNQLNYKKNEEVMLSCPEGFQPSFTHVKCSSEVQSFTRGKPVYREVWTGRNSRGVWVRIRSSVECSEVLQVDPGSFEISSTSIKLNWTCRFPDACQGMRAMCRLSAPSSPPCEAEELNGEQMLHGQEGTFTCSPLQPFTQYSVTIDLPPNTTLLSWLFRTEEAVPDKPEELWLDPDRGSLRWNSLPSCKGNIIGYQLDITARNAGDSSVLETERLRLNDSVTEHRLPEHRPGSSYAVMLRGLTAAGAGAALIREFHTGSSDTPRPEGISCRSVRDVAPSQGTAVLPLRPIARPSEAAGEHQLIVATTHNASVIESICSGQPQLFNASTYLAAVLNLTAPTDFVLGDGSRGQGQHNAALRPGCDYTALLLLARPTPQAEKFTCVCYSFSVVAGQTAGQWHGIVIGLVVLLAVLLVAAVILWFVLSRIHLCFSRKRKYLPNKTKEDN